MNAESQAKINLILSLKNRVKTGMTEARKKVNSGVSEIKGRLSAMRSSHIAAFKAMRAEIPIFGRAMDLLGNPYVLIMAGAIALAGVLNKGLAEAEKFNHEFLAIKQLNLDKPEKEMEGYKKSIYDTAMATGQASTDMAKAFYDIQSATGLFGDDVQQIAQKVGNFSLATGAKLPDSVNQTVKAMKAFGLGVDEIDGLLASNAKTVQVGITTFDELARVQTEYAGAASMAGQNVDTANKIFAGFTAIAKDSVTAATMTKSAFEGLTQKNTVDGLKSIGISMYDAEGNMRNLDVILREVNDKFKNMTSQEIDALINKIGGPEGLRNMFGKLKTGADDFFSTMEAYDNSAFDLDKALENAKGDFTTLKTIVGNQFNTVMAQLGEKLLPKAAKGLDKLSNFLTKVYDNWDQIVDVFGTVIKVVGAAVIAWKAWTAAQWLLNTAKNADPTKLMITAIAALIALIIIIIKKYREWGAALTLLLGPIGMIINLIMSFKDKWDKIVDAFKNKGFLAGIKEIGIAILDAILYPIQQALELTAKFTGWKFAKNAASKLIEFRENILKIDTTKEKVKKEEEESQEESEQDTTQGDGKSDNGPGNMSDFSDESTGVSKITGSSKEIKNLQVNIQNLAKVDISQEQMQKMSPDELEDWFNDKMMRMVRNLERNYQ